MDSFSKWFDANSGYSLHQLKAKPLCGCCKDHLVTLEKQIYLPAHEQPLPLAQCAVCKRYYACCPQGFYYIDHLLKYRVESNRFE